MLEAVRRWLTGGQTLPAWGEFAAWAKTHRWILRRTAEADGWAMDPDGHHAGWRIEWGPAQRNFMSSHEFRIRVEAPLESDLQALVLDRPLLTRLDHDVYQQITDSVQTRLDDETPEEMRWLAMHPKLSPNATGLLVRDRYGAVGSDPDRVSSWIAGPLAEALKARADVVPVETVASEPFMLKFARGQIVLRQAAPLPRLAVMEADLAVAEAALAALGKAV